MKATRRRRPYSRRERSGMALLAVITAVAICMVIVNEFGTRTSIDMLQSRNNLDQMRAHYLARSSINLSDLVLRLQKRIDASQFKDRGIQLDLFAPQLMDAFGGDRELVEQTLGIPLEDLKGVGADIGTFTVEMKPVEGKINLNCAAASQTRNRALVYSTLEALIYPKVYDPVFEEPDAEGWRRDRKQQIEAIMDYIDEDLSKYGTNGAPEDYGYEGLKDPYRAKNKPLDSVSELKLVRGVDDRFWTLFGDKFRVGSTSECKVNLKSLDDRDMIVAIIYLAGAKDPTIQNRGGDLEVFEGVRQIADLIIQAQQFGPIFEGPADFAEFVKDPAGAMAGLLGGGTGTGEGGTGGTGTGGLGGGGGGAAPSIQLRGGFTGIELDMNQQNGLPALVESRPIRVYDVVATGEVARGGPLRPLSRTIRGTFNVDHVLQKSRVLDKLPANHRSGAFVYLREE